MQTINYNTLQAFADANQGEARPDIPGLPYVTGKDIPGGGGVLSYHDSDGNEHVYTDTEAADGFAVEVKFERLLGNKKFFDDSL